MENNLNDGSSDELLDEQQLKHMARHSKEIILANEFEDNSRPDLKRLENTLHAVLYAAEQESISAPHRVAAWNTLCALIDQISTASDAESELLVLLDRLALRGLDLYIQSSHKARPKSCKQLLATLGSALRRTCARNDVSKDVSTRLLRCIIEDEHHLHTKPSLQALSHFLNREVLFLRNVLSALAGLQGGSAKQGHSACQELLSILIYCLRKGDFGSTAAQAVSTVLDRHSVAHSTELGSIANSESDVSVESIWMSSLEEVVNSGQVAIGDLEAHVLPTLLKRDLQGYVHFLERQGVQCLDTSVKSETADYRDIKKPQPELLYAALRIGKELGLLLEHEGSEISYTPAAVLLPVRFIRALLPSNSRQARITGLSLLVTSHAMTRSLSSSSLKLIKRYLHMFFADTDSNFRSQIFSLLQKLMDRLRGITMAVARRPSDRDPLLQYRAFIEWLLRFISVELRPTANYQRHISALKILSIVARSGIDTEVSPKLWSKSALSETKWPFHISIMNPRLRHSLLDLFMNPFDDVRQASASILAMYSAASKGGEIDARKQTLDVIRCAEDLMLSTGRADHADGVAQLYALLYREMTQAHGQPDTSGSSRSNLVLGLVDKLDRMLEVAVSGLSEAVRSYPIHGLFITLRYFIHQNDAELWPQGVLDRLSRSLHQVWSITKPVLCNDAPEGYSPDELDEMPDVSTKDTLSYCWRALKESSLLLEAVVSRRMGSHEMLLQLADLSFTQLAELRHRGAFSTVAQTWVTCCIYCQSAVRADQTSRIYTWYERILGILVSRHQINTRRSAGLPALICGLLISDKTGELMSEAFKDLSAIASYPTDPLTTHDGSLSQVHALNCIKDILKSTRLREHSESYVPKSLRLGTHALRSQAWAIRNCGLMLFRAVIDRLLGTSDAHFEEEKPALSRLTVPHHPELLDLVLDLLVVSDHQQAGIGANTFEGVFPALQLLQRMTIPEDRISAARNRVFALTASTSWHVRDKAARTYASLVNMDTVGLEVERRLHISTSHQNAVHGALASVRYLLRNLRASSASYTASQLGPKQREGTTVIAEHLCIYTMVLSASDGLFRQNPCVITRAAYVDVLTEVFRLMEYSKCCNNEIVSSIRFNVQEELRKASRASHMGGGNAVLRAALARALGVAVRMRLAGVHEADLLPIIQHLGSVDADACCLFFQEALQSSNIDNECSLSDIVLNATREALAGDSEVRLKCVVQRLLLNLVDQNSSKHERTKLFELMKEGFRHSLDPLDQRSNQDYVDQWLQLEFVYFEYGIECDRISPEDTGHSLDDLVGHLCAAVQGHALFSHDAAAITLSRPRHLWQYLDRTNPLLFCRVCFAVYDILNDDDEGLRSSASSAASNIVFHDATWRFEDGLEPNEASKRLVQWMIQKWRRNSYFAKQAYTRAFGLHAERRLSVSEQLQQIGTVDNALFVEEKQNLYIDEAQETKVWAQVVLRLTPTTVPRALVSGLAHWVIGGLDALIWQAKSSNGGALGWSSAPEVFNLGLQVVHGVQTLLHMAQHGIRLPIRPSTLRLKLGTLSAAADSHDLHPLWKRELDRVWTAAVLANLRRCKAIIDVSTR